jgi:hypothetical protein
MTPAASDAARGDRAAAAGPESIFDCGGHAAPSGGDGMAQRASFRRDDDGGEGEGGGMR